MSTTQTLNAAIVAATLVGVLGFVLAQADESQSLTARSPQASAQSTEEHSVAKPGDS